MLGIHEQKTAQRQAYRHGEGRKKILLNIGIEEKRHRHHGHDTCGDMPNRQPLTRIPAVLGKKACEALLINKDYGKNRAQLHENVEHVGNRSVEAQHMPHDDHMPRGGHRQKLCQSLDYANYDRHQILFHCNFLSINKIPTIISFFCLLCNENT